MATWVNSFFSPAVGQNIDSVVHMASCGFDHYCYQFRNQPGTKLYDAWKWKRNRTIFLLPRCDFYHGTALWGCFRSTTSNYITECQVFTVELVLNLFGNWFWPFFRDGWYGFTSLFCFDYSPSVMLTSALWAGLFLISSVRAKFFVWPNAFLLTPRHRACRARCAIYVLPAVASKPSLPVVTGMFISRES